MIEQLRGLISGSKKARVIIDTNFLLLPGSAGIDIFTEINTLMTVPYDLYVIENTYAELQRIIEGKTKASGKDKFNAKLGFIMAKQKHLKTLKSSSDDTLVDDDIVQYADPRTFVATLDKRLQKRVKEQEGFCIVLRNRTNLRIL